MLHPDTLRFLADLKEHNHKEWFDENRPRYEAVRASLVGFVEQLASRLIAFEPALASLDPRKSLFRINRDIRFSKDKSPYKINMGAYLAPGGKNAEQAGYYLHIEPEGSFLAGGKYQPQPEELKNIRAYLDVHAGELQALLDEPAFRGYFGELQGERLKTMPKDYPKDHPHAELLKLKSFTVWHSVPDADVLAPGFLDRAVKVYEAMTPLTRFLNEAAQAG